MTVAGASMHVGASVGIAISAGPAVEEPTADDSVAEPATGDSATDDLIRRADHAMYQAKTAGKGSYQLAG
jgi:GGDEF domain-containing protein